MADRVQLTFERLVDLAERGPALTSYEDRVRWFCETLRAADPYDAFRLLVDARDRLRAPATDEREGS